MDLSFTSHEPDLSLCSSLCHLGHGPAPAHEHSDQHPAFPRGLYPSLVWTHEALQAWPCSQPGPIFIPLSSSEWLIWAQEKGRGKGGSPVYLPTVSSGPYIVMIVSVTAALTSSCCLALPKAQHGPVPKDDPPHSDWLVFLYLFIILHCPPPPHNHKRCQVKFSWTRCLRSSLQPFWPYSVVLMVFFGCFLLEHWAELTC